jgi:YD repeat-containing protein
MNRLEETVTPAGEVSSSTYDDYGDITEAIDATGLVTATSYDQRGFAYMTVADANATDPDMIAITVNRFDPNGNVIDTIDPNEVETAMQYDGENRLTQTTVDPLGTGAAGDVPLVTHQKYDGVGNVIQSWDAKGYETDTFYDR